jgi:predicted permease
MKRLARFRSWLEIAFHRSRMESEMDAEMRFHIEAHAEELMRRGVPRAEALERSRLAFGGQAQVEEECRDARGSALLDALGRDAGYGLRIMRRNPGFAAMAVITLALGIGATTAVFSLVNAVLLRALPYHDPDRLVFLWEPNPRYMPAVPLEAWGPFNGDFYDWQKANHTLAGLALFTTDRVNLSVNGAAVRVNGSRVTGDFFHTLGIAPVAGRAVGNEDDQPGKGQVAVISHALWQSRFGSDAGALGKQILVNAKPYRIIGVMPAGFAFPHGSESLDTTGTVTDLWIPWAMTAQERSDYTNGAGTAIGRVRAGASLSQVQAEMSAIVARDDPRHIPELRGATFLVRPFEATITGGSRQALLIFMGAVILVLLIACGNVASLLLARASYRAPEMTLRTALGASRFRLIRQLLAESLCLAGAGGVLGVLMAFLAVRVLINLNPGNIPRLEETRLDIRVLLFAIAASLATAVLAGIFPALSVSRCALNEALKRSGNRSVKGAAGRFRDGLMIAEVALTFVLLAGAGLLIRSLTQLQSVDKGFTAPAAVTMNVQLDGRYDSEPKQDAFIRSLLDRSGHLPGVVSVAAINHVPLDGGQSVSALEVEGHPFDQKILFEDRSITPGYFTAMGIPVLAGRAFTDGDSAGKPLVAMVSRSFARRYFPKGDVIGKKIHHTGMRTIVGVVADVRQFHLETAPPMQVYRPMWQEGTNNVSIVVRSNRPPDSVAADMRALVRDLDPAEAVGDVRTMDELVSRATAERRFQTLLLTAFGVVAMFLSLVGSYALMAYAVERRTAEIGIRMALGAQRARVLGMVLKQGSALALAGVGLGFACAWGVMRFLASLLFEIKPTDLPTYLIVALLFTLVALGACYFPARRATRVDPMVALRYE